MNKRHFIVFPTIFILLLSIIAPAASGTAAEANQHLTKQNPLMNGTSSQVTDPKRIERHNQLQFGYDHWKAYTGTFTTPINWTPTVLDANGNFTHNGLMVGTVSFLQEDAFKKTTISSRSLFGGAIGGNKAIAQSLPTIKGHRYQIAYQGSYSPLLDSPQDVQNGQMGSYPFGPRGDIEVLNTEDINSSDSLVPEFSKIDPSFDQLKTATFIGTGDKITISVKLMTDSYGTVSMSLTHFSVLDLDQGIAEVELGISQLFTDDTHTKLRPSVNQQDIDAVQDQIDLDLIVNLDVSAEYQKELNKAQSLLDLVNPAIQLDQLVDDPSDKRSHTITGRTYPEALVHFESRTTLPEAALPSDDPRVPASHHVRADENGDFQLELPEDTFFSAGEVLQGTSRIHGKTATARVTVQDVVAPDAPVLASIKDQDQAFTGQAEPDSTVAILDADHEKVASAKTDKAGNFSVSIPTQNKPLVPYQEYTAMATDAAGNESLASESQTVQDTTPPEAKAVKQTFERGTVYPEDPREMLTDIYDNAGIEPENLEITYQTEPDLNLLGKQEITIKLEDKAGNRTLIRVPVEVTAIANSETKAKLKIDRKLAPAPFKQEIQPHSKTFTSPGTRSSKHIRVSTLPSTGDQGMALKVALGGILVLIALLMLAIRKKKRSSL